MSVTNRRPLARVLASGVVEDRHRDTHGDRTMTATPTTGGVIITISHSDGRMFSAVVSCLHVGGCAA